MRLVAVSSMLLAASAAFAQSASNPFATGGRREEMPPSSPSIEAPVHSNVDGEVLQLERANQVDNATSAGALEEPVDPERYVCGRGDVFELNFWGAQNFKVRVTADTEGRAFLPKVGYVDVVGKTLAQARASFKKAVSRLYPGLNFDVSLQRPRSFSVHVVGFVDKPGIYTTTPVERLSTLLSRASISPRGSRRRIEIRRRDGQTITADLLRYDQTGDKALNPYLMDDDTITVPFAALVVDVSGAVQRPGNVELIATKDLAEALLSVDGVRADATFNLPIRIIHRGANDLKTQTSITVAANQKPPNFALSDGDTVLVPSASELQRSILIIGPIPGGTSADEVTSTKRVPFVAGATVRSVVEGNGPVGASADLKGAYVRGDKGNIKPIDLEAILVRRDFSYDRPVEGGDTIVIPQKRMAVSIEGAVFRPGIYPYNFTFSSGQYIAVAGGPSRMAKSPASYRVISPEGKVFTLEDRRPLQPGDTLMLPERSFSRSEIVQLVIGSVGLALSAAAVVIVTVRN